MKYILYLILLLFAKLSVAQTPGDTAIVHTAPAVKKIKHKAVKKDSTSLQPVAAGSVIYTADTVVTAGPANFFYARKGLLSYRVLRMNPYYNFFGQPENFIAEERHSTGKEALFYIFTSLLFFFAIIKLIFNKYVNNLLGLIFRGSLRQKQIREQLLQTPLPSLFLNIFFVIVAGLYVLFLTQTYNIAPGTTFWLLLLYCTLAVGLVYLVKFLVLKLTGWIFNMRDAADTYIFIVFLVNKLLAIFLLPLLIIMAFSAPGLSNIWLTLSYIMVAVFFAYRYIVSFAPVRREVKVSQFHFFMYLCAFEIIPLLLIYKVLLHFL